MKNWNRYFLIVLSLIVVQSYGSVAFAGDCIAAGSGDPIELHFAAIPAEGEETGTFALTGAETCFWRPTGVYPLSAVAWITIREYMWADGSGYVTYEVEPNLSNAARVGEIHVEDVVVHTVYQAADCVVTYLNAPSGADSVFVTNTACGKIIGFGPSGPPSSLLVYEDPLSTYEGLVYGPDEQVYACDPTNNRIVAYDPALGELTPINARDDFEQPSAPQCGWFTPDGSFIVTDTAGTGIYVFPNGNRLGDPIDLGTPTLIPDSDGASYEGVTMAANGDLLVIDSTNGSVKKFAYKPSDQSYGLPSTLIGPEATNSLGIARASNGDIFVGNDDTLNRYDSGGSLIAECSSPFGGGFINFIKVGGAHPTDSFESLYVVSVEGDLGTLWEIPFNYTGAVGTSWDCGATSVQIATLTGIGSGIHPLTGIAVEFTSRYGKLLSTDTKDLFKIPDDVQAFNFFDSLYEFRPPEGSDCTVEVTAHEFSPMFVQDLISDETIAASQAIPFWGDNGRVIGYQYVGDEETCPEGLPNLYQHAINAFYHGFNPHIMRCTDPFSETDRGCELITFQSYYPGFGFFPDDGRMGGVTPAFSYAFLVDATAEDTNFTGEFCGFQSPLDWPTDVNDDDLPEFNSGSDLPIKFTVADLDKGGNCQNGPFVRDTIIAVLSIARVATDFKPIENLDINGGGSFEDGRIVFDNPRNKNKPFALQVKLSEDGMNLPSGTYQIVVTDDTANTEGTDEYYFPTQVTYFQVR